VQGLIRRFYQRHHARILRTEWERRHFWRYNERAVEFAFVLRAIARHAPRTLLDVGSGTTALPALMASCGPTVTAIDNVTDYWEKGMVNRHWHVLDDDIQNTRLTEHFDMVTCISVLEHIRNYDQAVRNMLDRLAPGGHLALCGPYTEGFHVDDCYRQPGADAALAAMPYIGNSYSGEDLRRWLGFGAELVEAEYWLGYSGRHWALGERIAPPRPATRETGNHACLLLRRT
jgi:2-polyprenyl-3-methyl-5-hydroxy-6-metoxy-1,4-benzoquinol methylase